MQLENALRMTDPKTVDASSHSASNTTPEMSRQDVCTLLGYVQHQQPIGITLMEAKYKKCDKSRRIAVRYIEEFALTGMRNTLDRTLTDAEKQLTRVLARLALGEYCKTADDPDAHCQRCRGRGEIRRRDTGRIEQCDRCHGRGYKRLSNADIYRHIEPLLKPHRTATWFYSSVWMRQFIWWCIWCEEEADEANRACQRYSREEG